MIPVLVGRDLSARSAVGMTSGNLCSSEEGKYSIYQWRFETVCPKCHIWNCCEIEFEQFDEKAMILAEQKRVDLSTTVQSECRVEELNPKEALIAIVARIRGEWDNPCLMKLGALSSNITTDIMRIAEPVIEKSRVYAGAVVTWEDD